MAIPFHGYKEEEEEDQVIDKQVVTEPVGSSQVIRNESENRVVSEIEGESFVGQLLRELVRVYLRLSNNGRRRSVNSRGPVTNSANVDESSSHSQNSTSNMLPELICCHVQSQSPVMSQNDDATRPDSLPPSQQQDPNRPSSSPSSSPPQSSIDDLTTELSLDIKMCIDFSYQRIGRDLRQIADTFETTNNPTNHRRRHPAGNRHNHPAENGTQITIQFELVIKLVIPATLIGLSLAFFKKATKLIFTV